MVRSGDSMGVFIGAAGAVGVDEVGSSCGVSGSAAVFKSFWVPSWGNHLTNAHPLGCEILRWEEC